jgi:hypothetical protein
MANVLTLAKLQEEARQATENVVNRLYRHCRIGRVTKKVQILGGKWVVPPSFLPDAVSLKTA